MKFRENEGPEVLDPATEDESALVGMLFERITELNPDWPMAERTDLAMSLFAVVKKWAHNLELTSGSHSLVENHEHYSLQVDNDDPPTTVYK